MQQPPTTTERVRRNIKTKNFKAIADRIRSSSLASSSENGKNCSKRREDSIMTFQSEAEGLTQSPRGSTTFNNINDSMSATLEWRESCSKWANTDSTTSNAITAAANDESLVRWHRLNEMSIFGERPELIPEQLKSALNFDNVPKGTLLLKQGDPIEKLYWILAGSFSVQQNSCCCLANDQENGNLTQKHHQERHCQEAGCEKSCVSVEAQKLNQGDWFPYFPSNIKETMTADEILKICANEKSDCSIVAEQDSQVAWIHLRDFLECIDAKKLIHQLNLNQIFRFNLDCLQDMLIKVKKHKVYTELCKSKITSLGSNSSILYTHSC